MLLSSTLFQFQMFKNSMFGKGKVGPERDRTRTGEPKSQPKKVKVTCRAEGCNKSIISQNMRRHLMEKHPDLLKAEPGNVRSKNDQQLNF